jgi:hypothetical protein
MSAHAYWRLNITANNGSPNNVTIAEMQYRTTVGGSNVATGGTATATNNLSGYAPSQAFDGNASTFWVSNTGPTVYLAYHFTSAVAIVEYTMAARNDNAAYLPDTPKNWTLDFSDDGATWTTLATVTGQASWGLGEVRTFEVPSQSQANKVYAEVVTDNGLAPTQQANKVYAEVITDNGLAARAQAQKVYLEVIGDLPAAVSSVKQPAICVCT